MAFQGMDIQAVKKAAEDAEQRATEIEKLISTLDGECQKVEWRGLDSEKFKKTDWPACKEHALNLVKTLREISTTLTENAEQQTTVSENY